MHIVLPPLAKLLRTYMRSKLRGRTRVTNILARNFPSLHSIPILIKGLTPVYVDLRDGHSHYLLRDSPYELPPWEMREQLTFRTVLKGGETVFDIGANLGFHLVLISHLVGSQGKVFAFEPNPRLLKTLKRTVSHLSNTKLFSYALSDEQGEKTFFIPQDHLKSSLGDWTKQWGVAHQVNCQTRRVDDLVREGVLPIPDFIKCDVEGAELKVFIGAEKTLDREDAPVILFEANIYTVKGFDISVTAAMDFLASLKNARYKFYEQLDDGYSELQYSHKEHANILAVPEGKLKRYTTIAAVNGS